MVHKVFKVFKVYKAFKAKWDLKVTRAIKVTMELMDLHH